MTTPENKRRNPEPREQRNVVACYECSVSREAAAMFCEQLAARFWDRCSLNVSWWSFALLINPNSAQDAADQASAADLVVIAARPRGSFPPEMREWLENWAGKRQDREGSLVGLMAGSGQTWADVSEKDFYLRQLAHRAGLDYLTGVPPTLIRPMPDSLESYNERADQMTTVLDEILRLPSGPPREPVAR